jgi:hypothetical protein
MDEITRSIFIGFSALFDFHSLSEGARSLGIGHWVLDIEKQGRNHYLPV